MNSTDKLFFLTVFVFLFACKKEDVEIVTLSKAGEEFYYGEKVPVWAGTEGDRKDVSYEWSATGGAFDGWRTQNLYENLWIAPAKAGEYTVTAKAKTGNTTSSKSATMKVTRYFFDNFQSSYSLADNGWSQSNTTQAIIADPDPGKSRIELTSSSTSAPNIRRTLNLADLKIPFSIRTKLGWKTYFRDGQAITISLYFRQPAANKSYPYIREIRWEHWPTVNPATTDNYQIRYEVFTPTTNVSMFSANSNTAATLPSPLPLLNPVRGRRTDLASADGVEKSLSFSINKDHVFYAYINGELWFQSNGIKDWLAWCKSTYPGFEDPVAREFRVAFPARASASASASTIFISSVYINDDDEILK